MATTQPLSLGQAALKYARRGWTVIPLVPGDKNPLVKWTDWQNKVPDELQIRRWWKQWPNANVGAVTGKGFVVVDLDTYKGGKNVDVRKWMEKAPTRLVARSARGGWHFYYEPHPDIHTSASEAHHVDVRAGGGVIALPPSVFEGKLYQWRIEGAPGKLDPALLKSEFGAGGKPRDDSPLWISELWEGREEGTRNDSAAALVGYFIGQGLPRDIVYRIMHDWDARNTPPMGDEVIKTVIDSVRKKDARTGLRRNQHRERPFAVAEFRTFMEQHAHVALGWDIDDWLPENTVLMVSAPPGAYKTWLTYDLAVSIATGLPFLGEIPVKRPGPVLIVQQEDSLPGIAGRFSEVMAAKYGLYIPGTHPDGDPDTFEFPRPPEDPPIFFHPDRSLSFEDQTVMADFEAAIERIKPRLVILDPLYSMANTESYMDKIGEHMLVLKGLRDRYACSFVVVHHSKKNTTGSRDDVWGSVFVNASREGGWQIAKPDETGRPNIISLRRFFKDGEEFTPVTLQFDIDTKSPQHEYAVKFLAEGTDAGIDILTCLADAPMTEEELMIPTKMDQISIQRRLKTLQQQGKVYKKARRWVLAPSIEDMVE